MAEAKGQADSRRGYLEVDGSGAMTELVFLLELNGPMADLESDLIDGFNDMIARLREERSDILVWLWKEIAGCIDHKKITHCIDHNTRVPIKESALIEQGCFTRLLTLARQYRREHPEDFVEQDSSRGRGGLFDSIGASIHMARQEYRRTRPEDRPVRTMFIIVTDNTEIETANQYYWTPDRVRALVHQQEEEEGWAFILLGANIDAVKVAGDIGIPTENAATFACDAAGVCTNFEALSAMISSFAKGAGIPPTWSAQITEHLKKVRVVETERGRC